MTAVGELPGQNKPSEKPSEPQQDLLTLYCSSLYRKCSNCGRTGHNSRTCLEARSDGGQITQGDAQVAQKQQGKSESADAEPAGNKEELDASETSDQKQKAKEGSRKKGVAWTEEEHKQFLHGLSKLGKGNWRGISRHFVKTKSPTQVASHAQKYFIRQTGAGKRKRRSSLFDLVPEGEIAKPQETTSNATAHTTVDRNGRPEARTERPPGQESSLPAIPPMQGPEAMAWSYWYQTMMMHQNPMHWLSSMVGPVLPPNFPQNLVKPETAQSSPQVPFGGLPNAPAMSPAMLSALPGFHGTAPDPNSPAMAAYLAQQSQVAAMLAMHCLPQISPDYLAKYAAGLQIHSQAAQAAQSAISSKQDDDKLDAEGSADDNLSAMETPSQTQDDDEPVSKFPRRSDNGSRIALSNVSTETEEFGNGALVKPKASKARSWVELPTFLQDRKDTGSLLNSQSKQSTQVGFQQPTIWAPKTTTLEGQTFSSQDPRPAGSASNMGEGARSETPSVFMDPNLATSHYKAQSEAQPQASHFDSVQDT